MALRNAQKRGPRQMVYWQPSVVQAYEDLPLNNPSRACRSARWVGKCVQKMNNKDTKNTNDAPGLRPPGPNDLNRSAGRGWQRMPWGWHYERYGDIRCKVTSTSDTGAARFGKVLAWGPAAGVPRCIPMPTGAAYAKRLMRALTEEAAERPRSPEHGGAISGRAYHASPNVYPQE